MGEAARCKAAALKAGKPWPPTELESKPRVKRKYVCGHCGSSVTQMDMPMLACRCGVRMWNTMEFNVTKRGR